MFTHSSLSTYLAGCGKRTSLLQFGNKFLDQERFSLSTVRSRLTALSIRTRKDGRHLDGEVKGLHLEVTRAGTSRRWLLRFVSPTTGRPTEAGLGTYPDVSLADARKKASKYRSQIADGIDPIHAKREDRAAKREQKKASTTFSAALDVYVKAHADKWGRTSEVEALLRRHASTLLPRPLASITTNDVLAALAPVKARLPKTAARTRAAISTVIECATAHDMFAGANPARREVFKHRMHAPPASTPHRMMPFAEVPSFFARLSETPSSSRLCLQFLILTAARSQEVIKATWDEIDLNARLWTIPAERMKKRRIHKVPLSDATFAVLEQARDVSDGRFVFGGTIKGSPLNSRALQSVTQKRLQQPYAVHGFRASFSTWANETQPFAFEDVEACLAHLTGNAVSRAYDRAEKIAKRAVILEAWGSFVTGAQVSNVVPFAVTARP
jgi:integrase